MIRGSAALADRLIAALLREEEARRAVRDAVREQAGLLRELRAAGLPATVVAHRVAMARGLVLSLRERLRLGERLRKRAWRGTRRPAVLSLSHGLLPLADTGLKRAILPTKNLESDMAKLVKRTITEEYLDESDEEHDQHEVEDEEQGEDTDEEEDEEPASPRRTKASRK